MICPLTGPAYGQAMIAAKSALILFPVSVNPEITTGKDLAKQHASDMLVLINDGLGSVKGLSVLVYDPHSPSVERAVKEQQFGEKEILDPPDTTPNGVAKARKLAALMGADMALIGSVDSYVYQEPKESVPIEISVQAQTKPEKPMTQAVEEKVTITCTFQLVNVMTGKAELPIVITGRGTRGPEQAGPAEAAMGIGAAYEIAEKLLIEIAALSPAELGGTAEPVPVPLPEPEQRASSPSKNKSLIPAMIGALIVGFLLSGGG